MQIEYNSEWMSPTVELMKCLGATNEPSRNEEIGSIDYVIDNKNGKKLIRAMVDEHNNAAPAYVDTVRATIEELNEKKYSEAVILSKRITNSAHDIVAEHENLNIITPKMKHSFSMIEILSAIQKKTRDLCVMKCGKAPETREDCQGKKGRTYTCDIRRLSDDATFHATMKWKTVLLEDFINLCEIEKEIKKEKETELEVN
jgi:predicted RND superfamily exporter protein